MPDEETMAEPPVPGPPIFVQEPPPPPVPRHRAPRTALWLGGRVGWMWPFGSLYARGVPIGNGFVERYGVDIKSFASSGPTFEVDLGARLGRNYNVFGFWQRTALGEQQGSTETFEAGHGERRGGSSDFWGAGVRATSDADDIGFLTELTLGYRRARIEWEDGSAIEATRAFPEARFSVGADIRVTPTFSLSPMASFGIGGFGKVEFVDAKTNTATDLIGPDGSPANHGWFELHLGGHFDLAGRD